MDFFGIRNKFIDKLLESTVFTGRIHIVLFDVEGTQELERFGFVF